MRGFLKYFLYCITGIMFLAVGLIVYLVWLQPPFYFPKPTGKYAVGSRLYHWIDSDRKDIHSIDPASPYQELMVKVWYPVDPTLPIKPVLYAPDLFAYLRKTKPLVSLLSGTARKVYCHENPDTPISTDKSYYPVIIFSPGSGGRYDSNTIHCEELASCGYIIVGISHPGDSKIIRFSDGRTKTAVDVLTGKTFIERRKITDHEIIEERVADIRFVLDQLEILANTADSPFYKRLDNEHTGIFGQSLGGSAAVSACRRDSRIKAAVDMDGSLFGSDATSAFDKPLMFLVAGESLKLFEQSNFRDLQKTFDIKTDEEAQMIQDRYMLGFQKLTAGKSDDYIFVISGAGHIDFNDSALLIKYAAPALSRPLIKCAFVGPLGYGSIDGLRATEIINAYLVSFFDKYLKGWPSELLDSHVARYAEVDSRLS